jgi:hypothetical protein
MKNTNAIDKIIAKLSSRDYSAQWSRLTEAQKKRVKFGKLRFSYSLGPETLEAIETKRAYISGEISEEEYKSFCLKCNICII